MSLIKPIGTNGFPVEPDELDGSDDGIFAILADDRIVRLVGYNRIRCGSGHGCGNSCEQVEWEFESERAAPKGMYELICGLPGLIESRASSMSPKAGLTWRKKVSTLGFQLMTDYNLAEEVINDGVSCLLDQFN